MSDQPHLVVITAMGLARRFRIMKFFIT